MKSAKLILATPTVELVKARGAEFDSDPSTRLGEDALGQLRAHFPVNTENPHVLSKVLALNDLYSTRVLDKEVQALACYIAGREQDGTRLTTGARADADIDRLLVEGSPDPVDLIAKCDNLRRYFSFATKYCSWHNPDAYAIYDGNVDECLWSYKKQDGHNDKFPQFERQELSGYPSGYRRLREVVIEFCKFYQLGLKDPLDAGSKGSFNFKAIDKFLWLQGRSLLSAIKAIKDHGKPDDEPLLRWEHVNVTGGGYVWQQTLRFPFRQATPFTTT